MPVIDISIDLPAPPAPVFKALTDPADLERWIWGGMGDDPRTDVDCRLGGRFDISVHVNDVHERWGDRWGMRGVYIEIDAPRRLVYSLHWDASVGYNEAEGALDEVVLIDLAEMANDGTKMRYRHLGVPDQKSADMHEHAIRQTFDLLRQVVTSDVAQ